MHWTVELPRTVAEDDKLSASVEADTIEDAIRLAAPKLGVGNGSSASIPVGQVFNVYARVQVCKPSSLPLKSA